MRVLWREFFHDENVTLGGGQHKYKIPCTPASVVNNRQNVINQFITRSIAQAPFFAHCTIRNNLRTQDLPTNLKDFLAVKEEEVLGGMPTSVSEDEQTKILDLFRTLHDIADKTCKLFENRPKLSAFRCLFVEPLKS